MSTRVVHDRSFAAVISNTGIKSTGSQQAENTPQKGILPLSQLVEQMREKRKPLEENMERLKDVATKVVDKGMATKSEEREIISLLKQVREQISGLGDTNDSIALIAVGGTSGNAGSSDTGDTGTGNGGSGGGDDINNNCIMGGALAYAEQVMLEIQEKYQQLQALMTEISIDNIKQSPAMVQFMTNATANAANCEAQNLTLEGTKNWAQFGTTLGLGVVATGANQVAENAATKPVLTEQTNLTNAQKELNTTAAADPTVSSGPKATLEAQITALPKNADGSLTPESEAKAATLNQRITARDNAIGEIKNGQVPSDAAARKDAMAHLTPKEREDYGKRLETQVSDKSSRVLSMSNSYQRTGQYLQTAQNLSQTAANASISGLQATQKTEEGQANALKTVTQQTADQLQSTGKDLKDRADGQVQNQSGALQARQSLIDTGAKAIGGN